MGSPHNPRNPRNPHRSFHQQNQQRNVDWGQRPYETGSHYPPQPHEAGAGEPNPADERFWFVVELVAFFVIVAVVVLLIL